jgi:general secretion pathway protein C
VSAALAGLRWAHIARPIFWLALALFGWTAARFTIVALTPEPTLPVLQQAPDNPVVQAGAAAARITSASLFGETARQSEQKVVRARPSATISGLVLHGVMATGDQTAVAMIASDGGKNAARVYALNDRLPGGGVLYDVLPDHVLVDVGATRLRLDLRKLDQTTARPVALAPSAADRSLQQASMASPISLAALQEDLKNDPGALARRFVARPFRKGGVQVGYSVREIGRQEIMKKLGLRSGDIITRLNGIELNNDAQAFAAYQELIQAKSVVANVMRGNRTIEIKKTIE